MTLSLPQYLSDYLLDPSKTVSWVFSYSILLEKQARISCLRECNVFLNGYLLTTYCVPDNL